MRVNSLVQGDHQVYHLYMMLALLGREMSRNDDGLRSKEKFRYRPSLSRTGGKLAVPQDNGVKGVRQRQSASWPDILDRL